MFDNITRSIIQAPGNKDGEFTCNAVLKNCTFNVTANRGDLYVINAKQYYSSANDAYYTRTFTKPTLDVQILGGEFNFPHASASNMYLDMPENNRNIYFDKDDNGNYPIVNLKNVTKEPGKIVNTPDAEQLHFRKTAVNGDITSYVLNPYGFIGTSLNLGSDLNMLYRVFLPIGKNPTMTFGIDGYETTVAPIGADETGLYTFKLAGITPDKMNELICATLTVDGESFAGCNNVSINGYLTRLQSLYSTDESMMALVDSLFVYGAASEKYVDADVVTEDGIFDSLADVEVKGNVISSDKNGLNYCAMSLDGAFALRVGIVVEDKSGVTLEVTKNNVTTEYALADYIAVNGVIAFAYKNITALELDTKVTFTLKQNGEVQSTLTFCANDYLYAQQSSTNTDLVTLTKAIYAYGVAAEAYAVAHS